MAQIGIITDAALDEAVRALHAAEVNRDACRALLQAMNSEVDRLARAVIAATIRVRA